MLHTKSLIIPKNAIFTNAVGIVKKLKSKGFSAYFAGGCVRDLIMGREPVDVDIATSATPDDVISLFKKTVPVGKAFGVVIVIKSGITYEVATFRKDMEYKDGRHPLGVVFSDEKEDVLRRDFTVNGLLFDPLQNRIIDYVGGQKDINDKIIRCIGEPLKRFGEDKLRLLRCIRFSLKLGFEIQEQTYNALKKLSSQISVVSCERIKDELSKILTSKDHDKGLDMLLSSGLLDEILPEVSILKDLPVFKHEHTSVFDHITSMLKMQKSDNFEFSLAILLHDTGKAKVEQKIKGDIIKYPGHTKESEVITEQVCTRLKLSGKEKALVIYLVKNHSVFKKAMKIRKAELLRLIRDDNFKLLLEFHRLDRLSLGKTIEAYDFCKSALKKYDKKEMFPHVFLNGNDLIKLGYKPGEIFKEILYELENVILEGKIKSKKEALLWVEENFKL